VLDLFHELACHQYGGMGLGEETCAEGCGRTGYCRPESSADSFFNKRAPRLRAPCGARRGKCGFPFPDPPRGRPVGGGTPRSRGYGGICPHHPDPHTKIRMLRSGPAVLFRNNTLLTVNIVKMINRKSPAGTYFFSGLNLFSKDNCYY
jgi:hypothetical protein